jgi:hypothetical protein
VNIDIVVDLLVVLFGKLLPNAINLMDEIDESCWPVGRSKRHNGVGPFNVINLLKCRLLLTL